MRTTINGGIGLVYCEMCRSAGQFRYYLSGDRKWWMLPDGWWVSSEFDPKTASKFISHARCGDCRVFPMDVKLPETIFCDCEFPRTVECTKPVTMICACPRCFREPDDAFHSSDEHQLLVEEHHRIIRGRPADWRAVS